MQLSHQPLVLAVVLPFAVACGGSSRGASALSSTGDDRPATSASASATTPGLDDAGGPVKQPLFARMGGRDKVGRVVDFFLTIAVQDARIRKPLAALRADKDRRKHARDALVDQICALGGGGCTFTADMKEVHKGMAIGAAEWDGFVDDLETALVHEEIGEAERTELLGLLSGMKADIVTKK